MALVVAFIGGLTARRIGLPTIVGYLLAGIVIGPFTPGFVGDTETISQLAELGVIFLMFGVGLHFSITDLWKVRAVAIPGALGRMAITTLLGFGLSQLWGWTLTSGIVIGLAISIASTVVLLRGLMDNGLLNTPHGQAAIGWVIVEDLATVLILVLMPTLVNTSDGFNWGQLGLTLLKAAGFVILVLFAGTRLIPWVLMRIAHTRSRELFILAILAIALGIALGAAELFGVSLALGAFVAGVVVNESPLSHQVGADVLPFREAFAVLFFVSIGMLVNPGYIFNNIGIILALTGLIVIGKALVTMLSGLFVSMVSAHNAGFSCWPKSDWRVLLHFGTGGHGTRPAGSRPIFPDPGWRAFIHYAQYTDVPTDPSTGEMAATISRVWKLLNRHGPRTHSD